MHPKLLFSFHFGKIDYRHKKKLDAMNTAHKENYISIVMGGNTKQSANIEN